MLFVLFLINSVNLVSYYFPFIFLCYVTTTAFPLVSSQSTTFPFLCSFLVLICQLSFSVLRSTHFRISEISTFPLSIVTHCPSSWSFFTYSSVYMLACVSHEKLLLPGSFFSCMCRYTQVSPDVKLLIPSSKIVLLWSAVHGCYSVTQTELLANILVHPPIFTFLSLSLCTCIFQSLKASSSSSPSSLVWKFVLSPFLHSGLADLTLLFTSLFPPVQSTETFLSTPLFPFPT